MSSMLGLLSTDTLTNVRPQLTGRRDSQVMSAAAKQARVGLKQGYLQLC